jgi:hypothetical protein
VLPECKPLARPVALIVATSVNAELHVTESVKFCMLPSLKVPIAVNCCALPKGTAGVGGVNAIETRTAVDEGPVFEFEPQLADPSATSAMAATINPWQSVRRRGAFRWLGVKAFISWQFSSSSRTKSAKGRRPAPIKKGKPLKARFCRFSAYA